MGRNHHGPSVGGRRAVCDEFSGQAQDDSNRRTDRAIHRKRLQEHGRERIEGGTRKLGGRGKSQNHG